MSFVLTQSITLTQESIQKELKNLGGYDCNHNSREKEYPNTLESPYILTGLYNVPVNWPVFWTCLNHAKSSEFTPPSLGRFEFDARHLIKTAIEYYKNGIFSIPETEYYIQTRNALRKAEDDKKEADKAEEMRQRNAVPEITLKYDALQKENETLKKELEAYKAHLQNVKREIVVLDRRISEGNYTKWLTSMIEEICHSATLYYKNGRWRSPGKPVHIKDFPLAERNTREAEIAIHEQEQIILKGGGDEA